MFLLLTRVLVWLLVALIVYYVLLQWIPKQYLTFIGGLLILAITVMAFLNPNEPIVSAGWSILSFPLKPVGMSIVLLSLGLGKLKKGSITNVGKNQIWAAFIILLLSSIPVLAYGLAQQAELEGLQLEQRRQQICQGVCPADVAPAAQRTAGAIVVLGQGTTQAYLPYRTQIQLTETGDRILYAAQLYRDQVSLGNNPIVIVSAGPRLEITGNRSEATDIASLLSNMGVPQDRIVIEPRGLDVRTSAVAVAEVLQRRGIVPRRVILVSSGLNIRRANLSFANLGVQVIPRPTDFYTFQAGAVPSRRLQVTDFIPSVEALTVTTRVVDEYLSSIYYFLRGWLTPTEL